MRARLFQSLAIQVAEEGLLTTALSGYACRAFSANGVTKFGFQCSSVSTSAASHEASSSRGSGDQGRVTGGRQERAGRQAPTGSDGPQRADRAKQGYADGGKSRSLFRRDNNPDSGSRGGDGQRGGGKGAGTGSGYSGGSSGQRGGPWQQQQGGRQHDRRGDDRRGGGGGGGPPPMLRDGRDGRDGRGGGGRPPFAPSGPGSGSRAPRAARWDALDVAASNAPQRLLQLVGDPRSGVADDTSSPAFGEVTVELLHHQPSNEVYWYKYAFAGGQPGGRGGHRDGRLSDYSRNLAYVLRAKDPARWSVEALADKFRVRPQRMLAALALKELEAQRLESGALLRGPLSAYSLRVSLADVHLDKASGAPRLRPASAPPAASRELLLGRMLPRVVSATQRTQAALLSALRPHGFDAAALRAALQADVAAVEAAAGELDAAAAAAGGEGAEGGTAAGGVSAYLAPELAACRAAVEAVAAAVEVVVNASPLLQEERQAAALRARVEAALQAGAGQAPAAAAAVAGTGAGAGGGADGNSKDAVPAAAAAAATSPGGGEALEVLLQPLTQDGSGAPLQRFLFSLPPPIRVALLRQLPRLAAQLAAAGVDLQRAGRDAAYRGPLAPAAPAATPAGSKQQQQQRQKQGGAAASTRSGKLPRLTVDVLGFVPVSEAQAEALAAAVESAAAAEAALVAKLEALQVAAGAAPAPAAGAAAAAAAAAATAPSAAELRDARSLLRQYLSTHSMWGELRLAARKAAGHSPDTRGKRRKLEVMAEADPAALTRALQVEAHTQLRRSHDRAAAESLKAGVAAAAATEAAAAAAASGSEAAAKPPTPLSDPAGWDALAAWLDAEVAGRVYARGSGERLVVRLPTYPAFEGYPLSELDKAREGELGALNRLVAARTAAAQWAAFRRDLLFNLGVRGEKLRDNDLPGAPAWPANLRTELTRPVVVYGIGPDGATQYPPVYVAAGDGAKRPLNEQEKVYQERRLPGPRLPYHMGRIRTLPELN
ncbi:hypothetical protein CHLRE_06g254600v5 [Chlamydomonas reinhardtii]|uniref:Uncharacterized protein n=1 Tax=Chlamydomonas reinhardtii TaxID=3055 RepID=A0A2K3DM91_CHLRE|nr:uncharacterized protein CHLRE_06g254600v5 [Chlamydomonas reinhardtii]PNW81652.1 hypothetical protein CHLRE_06g254600v5 [Chlamydomonas reinhardtii]7PKQ_C Chain C, mS45 [Chlamydomonas reinhardtii]